MTSKFLLTLCLSWLATTSFSQHTPKLWGVTASGGNDNLGTLFHYDPAGNTYVTDHSVVNMGTGSSPEKNDLINGGGGKYYGLTANGGKNFAGTLFVWDSITNTYTTKFHFSSATGSQPKGSLLLFGGKLYGMTNLGGANNKGVIFEWDPVLNVYTKKFDMATASGGNPAGSLAVYGAKLYGMTSTGGVNNKGVIFEWDPASNVYVNKYSFITASGITPYGSLTLVAGKFYGMTWTGGSANGGVIFEWDPAANVYTKKIDMVTATGKNPYGDLVYYASKFYGMTNLGGASSRGVIFEWDPGTNVYTKKKDFSAVNGAYPRGSLTLKGTEFYGLTYSGGATDHGVIFEWSPASNIYNKKIDLSATAGRTPYGSITLIGGNFYGLTNQGGQFNQGVLFQWNPVTNAYLKKVNFNSNYNAGSEINGSLVLYNGKFYGMSCKGGDYDFGVIFQWDPLTNTYTKMIDFDSINGANPQGSLVVNGSKLYGLTSNGGANAMGVIFEWDPSSNVFTKKVDLNSANGSKPYGTLLAYSGKFYGLTSAGGLNNIGVIFEWDPALNFYTKKIDFSAASGGNPYGSLALNGTKLYGMTSGGADSSGVIFEWAPSTNVFVEKVRLNSIKGHKPYGTLVLKGADFYGMTFLGGAYDQGTIFKWTPASNIFTKKIDFDYMDGANPHGSLLLSGSGIFYGITTGGGSFSNGILFEWNSTTNIFTKKLDFSGTTGSVKGASPELTHLVEANVNTGPLFSNNASEGHLCMNSAGTNTFSVVDHDNDPLTFTTSSSNTALLPNSSITFTSLGSSNYQVSFTPSPGQAGSTIITITANDGFGGIVTYVYTLTVHSAPVINVSSSAATVCPGQAVTLTASGATTYSWTNGINNGTAFTPASSSTYTVTGTDVYGCVNTSTASVNVGSPTITVNSAAICQGATANLVAAGGTTYTWTGGGTGSTLSVSPSATTTYTVTGSVGSCSNTAVATVTVTSVPTISVTATLSTVCQGQPVTLTGGGATAYSWTGGVTNGVSFIPAATTTYTVTGTTSGCSASATVTVTVNGIPAVTANTTASSVCQGQPVTLTGGGAAAYSWTGGITNGASFMPAATTTYTVTGTTSGCTASATVTVTVNGIPAVTASTTASSICQGQPVTLTGGGAAAYSWTGGVTNGVPFIPAATTTYTVTGTTSGCSGTVTLTIDVIAIPVVAANASASSVCPGQSVILTGGGADSYTWTGGVNNGIPFIPSATDTYTVTGTSSGCSSAASVIITVNPPVIAEAGADDTICFGETAILNATPGAAGNTFSWSPVSGLSNPLISNPSASPATTTTYSVIITDNNGCTGNSDVIITVGSALVLATTSADPSCFGFCDGITAANVSGGIPPYSYAWSSGCITASCSNICPGTYTVTVQDSIGCITLDSVVIAGPSPVDASVVQTIDSLTASAPSANYQWIDCDNGAFITGATSQSFNPVVPGNYAVIVADGIGCTDTSACFSVVLTGILKTEADEVRLFPNPVVNTLFVEFNGSGSIEIYNPLGQIMMSSKEIQGAGSVDMTGLRDGTYFIMLKQNGRQFIRRIEVIR
ncbi:MAG TPA: choice-of-anchor tandem repeat GloVer-containing protein [Bacteroidia bacterium]